MNELSEWDIIESDGVALRSALHVQLLHRHKSPERRQPQSTNHPCSYWSDAASRSLDPFQNKSFCCVKRGATEPSHRVDRVQGRGQEEDKRRTRPSHRAQPQSPATEFRGAASECGQLFSFKDRTPTVNCLGKKRHEKESTLENKMVP